MSDIRPLQEVETSSFRDDGALDPESIRAIQNTLGVLSSLSTSSDETASFSPSNFTLFSSKTSSKPSKETLSFLRTLLLSTTQSALSNSTSSFLAGCSSESDEYGDVAVYICQSSEHDTIFGKGSEYEVISLLGFSNILSKDNISIKPCSTPNIDSHQHISKLEDVYRFRVEGATGDGTVLFFLIGRYQSEWLGIIGIGVWS